MANELQPRTDKNQLNLDTSNDNKNTRLNKVSSSKKSKKHSKSSRERSRERSHSHSAKKKSKKSKSKKKSRSRSRSRSRISDKHKDKKMFTSPPKSNSNSLFKLDKNILRTIKDVKKLTNENHDCNYTISSSSYSFNISNTNKNTTLIKNTKEEIKDLVEFCKNISKNDDSQAYKSSNSYYSSRSNEFKNNNYYENNSSCSKSDHQLDDQLAIAYDVRDIKNNSIIKSIEKSVTKLFPVSSGTIHRKVEQSEDIDYQVYPDTNSLDEIKKSENILDNMNESLLGKFTGYTDIRLLTPEELEGEFKAWTRKDLLKNAAPITQGVGKKLLEKMGWREGQGLGKYKEGPVEPIKVDIKTNRKGLVNQEETINKQKPQLVTVKNVNSESNVLITNNEGKHPVSVLMELCQSNHWPEPIFEVVEETGPPHMRNFLMKCILNNKSYQPDSSSPNKKLAKALAASVCLKSLGFIV